MRHITLVFVVVIINFIPVNAQQKKFNNYDEVQANVFWQKFYFLGGETLYCGIKFGPGQREVNERKITIEHVYSAHWLAEKYGCDNRDCGNVNYKYAESDLHNLWPAIGNINSSRQDKSLGEIPGEKRRFEDYCPDYERTSGENAIVEPRDAVKGDMARSILYMLDAYGLELRPNMKLEMLLKWHLADPPDDTERWRNRIIEKLQGTRNPYIQ